MTKSFREIEERLWNEMSIFWFLGCEVSKYWEFWDGTWNGKNRKDDFEVKFDLELRRALKHKVFSRLFDTQKLMKFSFFNFLDWVSFELFELINYILKLFKSFFQFTSQSLEISFHLTNCLSYRLLNAFLCH